MFYFFCGPIFFHVVAVSQWFGLVLDFLLSVKSLNLVLSPLYFI